MLPQGPATRIIVPPNVEILAFLASFRAILTVFWADFAPLGPLGAFWALFRPFWALLRPFWGLLGPFLGPFGPFWYLFDTLSLVASSPWWQALEFEAIYFFPELGDYMVGVASLFKKEGIFR